MTDHNGNKDGAALSRRQVVLHRIEQAEPFIRDVLPSSWDDRLKRRFVEVCYGAVRTTPEIANCEPRSVAGAFWACARLGLVPDPALGHVYIVPRKVKGTTMALMWPGYKGYIELARQSGRLGAPHAEVVYANDRIEVHYGTRRRILHQPWYSIGQQTPGKPLFAYATWIDLDTQTPEFRVAERDRIERARGASVTADKSHSPWQSDETAMWKKTAVLEAAKVWPLTPALAQAVQWDEEAERGVRQSISPQFDADRHPPADDAATDPLLEGAAQPDDVTEGERTGKEQAIDREIDEIADRIPVESGL